MGRGMRMSYRKHLMTSDEPPSELYKAAEVGTNLAEVSTGCSEFPNNSDAISRQAAMDALEDAEDAFGYLTKDWREVLEQLPPIQPERKECEEREQGKCPWYAG